MNHFSYCIKWIHSLISHRTDRRSEREAKIVEICEKLDNVSLANLMRASSRVYQVCQDVFLARKNEYLMEPVEFYTKLDLTIMHVSQLKDLLKRNKLKIPVSKASMIKILLKYKIGKDKRIHPEMS